MRFPTFVIAMPCILFVSAAGFAAGSGEHSFGSGNVTCRGNPNITLKTSGSGKVLKE